MIKRLLCALTIAALLLPCAALCATVPAWLDEEGLAAKGYVMEGDTLVFPEGATGIGYQYDAQDNLVECDIGMISGDMLSQRGVKAIRLPSTLRYIGGAESVAFLTLEELTIPEGVETLLGCFYGCDIGTLYLPSTLKTVNAGSFSDLYGTKIVLSPDNPYYTVQNGALYTKDMQTLVRVFHDEALTAFTVPAGVKTIADGAFAGLDTLQSVSLPIGLSSIGRTAFYRCGRLARVNVPLTVTDIGRYAFVDCVSLQSVTLPKKFSALLSDDAQARDALNALYSDPYDVPYCDTMFDNCPMLSSAFAGDNAETSGKAYDTTEYVVSPQRYTAFIINPDSASDKVRGYASPSKTAKRSAKRYACGTVLQGYTMPVTWQMMLDKQTPQFVYSDGVYFSLSDVVVCADLQWLFRYDALTLPAKNVTCYAEQSPDSKTWNITAATAKTLTPYAPYEGLQFASVGYTKDDKYRSGYIFLADIQLAREYTGDAHQYGIVTASAPQNRVNLRQQPSTGSKRLGRYFTGTQLEILGEQKGFYRVRIQNQEGYIAKEYVRIVPQAAKKEE